MTRSPFTSTDSGPSPFVSKEIAVNLFIVATYYHIRSNNM